jgi:phosphoglycolate phosphatase-like HAD superfamily hydrolase
MRNPKFIRPAIVALGILACFAQRAEAQLESWQSGATKQAIIGFVNKVTDRNSPEFVESARRIAVFDNDGTLWIEQPIYVQFAFAIDRVKALAPQHPSWQTTPPFNAVLTGDHKALEASGEKGLLQLIAVSHAGMTTDAFADSVSTWLQHARHPRFQRRYTELVYQPMIELLHYLRSNGFKTFIVSGGGVEFMRAFAEAAYGIPPEQVIGSVGATKFQTTDAGRPELIKEAKVEFVDDGPGKPASINRVIGRRPIFAFGNSDGDQQMLQWTAGAPGASFVGLVHHTDEDREYAYDRASRIGQLDKALDEAKARRWTIVDVKRDWRTVFPARD